MIGLRVFPVWGNFNYVLKMEHRQYDEFVSVGANRSRPRPRCGSAIELRLEIAYPRWDRHSDGAADENYQESDGEDSGLPIQLGLLKRHQNRPLALG